MAFNGAVENAIKSGDTSGISPVALSNTDYGNSNNAISPLANPLVSNYLKYNTYGYSPETIANAKAALEAAKKNQTSATTAPVSPNNSAAKNAGSIAANSNNPADMAAYLSALDNQWGAAINAQNAANAAQQALNGRTPGNAVDDGSGTQTQNPGQVPQGGGDGGSGYGGGSGGGRF